MKKVTLGLFSLFMFVSVTAAHPGTGTTPPEAEEIDIQVSPSTLLLNWTPEGNVRVTVHTDVQYDGLFESTRVFLEGVEASSVFADARGDLVAKFNYLEIARLVPNLVEEGFATITLEATDINDNAYWGQDEVRVKVR